MSFNTTDKVFEWVVGIAEVGASDPRAPPPRSSLALLDYASSFLEHVEGLPNKYTLFRPAVLVLLLPLKELFDPSNANQTPVDMLTGPWAYSLDRHQLAHMPPTPGLFSGIFTVMSLDHVKPLSMWLLFDLFDTATWITIAAHLIGVFILLLLITQSESRDTFDVFLNLLRMICGQDFDISQFQLICRTVSRMFLRSGILAYFLWVCFIVQQLFDQELLSALFRSDHDKIESAHEATQQQDVMIAISRDAPALHVRFKDFIASNQNRLIITPGLMPSVDVFFRRDSLTGKQQRVAAIYSEMLLRFIAGLYPQFNLYIGSEIGPNVPIGTLINWQLSQKYGLPVLRHFQRSISMSSAIGMIQYWDMRDRLMWRAMIAGARRRAGSDTTYSNAGQDHFKELQLDHLRLAFTLWGSLMGISCVIQTFIFCEERDYFAFLKNMWQ